MLYFSLLLKTNPTYKSAANRLFAALDSFDIKYNFISNTSDIWVRDFMPTQLRDGSFVSFRYEPSYLTEYPELKTDFKDVSPQLSVPVTYSNINLDGGNLVFSPSKKKVVISDRVFAENPALNKAKLVQELEKLLKARVIIIPSLKSDLTGHADGMVRFLDEDTALCNPANGRDTLELRITRTLANHGIETVEFPYFFTNGISAEGSYLNYLETEKHLFLPMFGKATDQKAAAMAKSYFKKAVIPIKSNEIAKDGGILNCISWEAKI